MAKFESKDIILTRNLNNVMYEIMVKTTANMVYTDDDTTLTETLSDLGDALVKENQSVAELQKQYNDIVKDAPEAFKSFKEIYDYININGDPKSELIRLIESKQDKEEGKGLSTHDFSDILYEKLLNDYTKEELDAKFKVIIDGSLPANLSQRVDDLEKAPNTIVTENVDSSKTLNDGSCWFQIIRKDA